MLKHILVFGFTFCFLQNLAVSAQNLKDDRIDECSGLVVSFKSDDLLWVHNDSGDKSRIFLINKSGETLAVYNFNADVVDCEDIAKGIDAKGEQDIFVGDIGDNRANRPYISIYKFKEPSITYKSDNEISIDKVEQLKFQYPDGARDAECLMVDPIDKKIYIISKREDSVGVYSAPLISKSDKIITLKKELRLFFPGFNKAKRITAGDISLDGRAILIKSYTNVFYWERTENESLLTCLKRNPKLLPYQPEKQGEAIGFTNNAKQYYTISEGKYAKINFKKI